MPSLVKALYLLPDRLAAGGVEALGRLVQEEDARLVHQRACQVEAALHAAGVGLYLALRRVREANQLQHLVRPPASPRSWTSRRAGPAGAAAHAPSQAVEARLLQRDADRAPDGVLVL